MILPNELKINSITGNAILEKRLMKLVNLLEST
jgi:hypothetical protein